VEQHQFPPRPETVREMYSHRLLDLLRLAGLRTQLEDASATDGHLGARWLVVKDWSEESRYALPLSTDAEQLYTAVADPTHGVLQWLRQYW
jgi:hypothetical protein